MKQVPLFKVFMPENVNHRIEKVLKSGFLSEGTETAEFTSKFSNYIGNQNTLAVNSCTSALHLALILSGVGPETEVISTPLTAIATNLPIKYLGGRIKWADVDPETGMIDPVSIESKISSKTKAIIVLHKDGDLAEIDKIQKIADQHDLRVIVDAAHSVGARFGKYKVGQLADFTCFSFQAIKQLSTGDGGALSCKREADFWKARKLKWFGVDKAKKGKENPWYNDVKEIGYKYDLMEVNAAIGMCQLDFINELISKANENGEFFNSALSGVDGISVLRRKAENYSSYWAYTLKVDDRAGFIQRLSEKSIDSMQIHPRNDKWTIFENSVSYELPGVDTFNEVEVSLPSGWWVTKEIREYIVDVIKGGW